METMATNDCNKMPQRFSPSAVSNSLLRAIFVFGLAIVVPFFLIPHAKNIFEEFGIELPNATKLLLSLSDWVRRFAFFSIPIVVSSLLAVEIVILTMPLGIARRWLNFLLWGMLALFIIFVLTSTVWPLSNIYGGPASSLN